MNFKFCKRSIGQNEIKQQYFGLIFRMWHDGCPRNIENIYKEFDDFIKKEFTAWDDFFYIDKTEEETIKLFDDFLDKSQYFRELNIPTNEYKAGIRLDNQKQGGFVFVSMYDSIPAGDDFIDLDAFKGHFLGWIRTFFLDDMEEDYKCSDCRFFEECKAYKENEGVCKGHRLQRSDID